MQSVNVDDSRGKRTICILIIVPILFLNPSFCGWSGCFYHGYCLCIYQVFFCMCLHTEKRRTRNRCSCSNQNIFTNFPIHDFLNSRFYKLRRLVSQRFHLLFSYYTRFGFFCQLLFLPLENEGRIYQNTALFILPAKRKAIGSCYCFSTYHYVFCFITGRCSGILPIMIFFNLSSQQK